MSLMDSLGKGMLGQLGNLAGGGQNANLIGAIAGLVGSRDIGGLSGLAQLFQQRGYGDTVNSWVSPGENQPISPQALQNVLGEERVQQVAERAGVSREEASRGLADLLPQLVDRLTPDGQMPDNNSSMDLLSQLAGRFMGRH